MQRHRNELNSYVGNEAERGMRYRTIKPRTNKISPGKRHRNLTLRLKRRKNFDGCPGAIKDVPVHLMVIGGEVSHHVWSVLNCWVSHLRVDDA